MNKKHIQTIIPALLLLLSGCTPNKHLTPCSQTLNRNKITARYTVEQNKNTIAVSSSDPVALRTLLMQGFSLDLSGEYNYTILIPSAKDVENQITRHPGEVKATLQDGREKRPDIRPVVSLLNKKDAPIQVKDETIGKAQKFTVSLDENTGTLTYTITLARPYAMNIPVNMKLTSRPVAGADEFQSKNFSGQTNTPQPFGVGQPSGPNTGQREMTLLFSFQKK